MTTAPAGPALRAPAAPTSAAAVALRPVPLGAARTLSGFWAERQRANAAAVRAGYERLESAGNLDNLRIAAGTKVGSVRGPVFMDSDVHKWLEAAAWEHGRAPSQELLERQREVTALVAAAQQGDGYLNSVVQVREQGARYRDLAWSHEHYCAGHLFQAAVAQVRCTGDTALLEVATRFADHLVATFGPGLDERVDGHPVVETGLVELFRETGRRAYLDLARWFVDARGRGTTARGGDPTYFSDRVPVRGATTVEGHAVRAVYLTTGAADVAAEDGDAELLAALVRQWEHMVATKAYVTGGLGSRWDWERFGDEYELPPDRAYAESCAAIGSVQWAHRMLLATGEARYADLVERTLYNALLPGVSLGGGEYFYVNALQVREGAHADEERSVAHGRRAWFDCACCPPNVMRTLASLDAHLATSGGDGVQLHQFAPARIEVDLPAGRVVLAVATRYPWDGAVRVRVEEAPGAEWELAVRVPAWAEGASATAAGEAVDAAPGGYLRVRRAWRAGEELELDLPMPVRVVEADPRVDAVRGCVAVERGPLVYAVEQADVERAGGGGAVAVDDLRVDVATLRRAEAEHLPGFLGGVTVLRTRARRAAGRAPGGPLYRPAADQAPPAAEGDEFGVTAVPYFAWANRGPGAMRVWLPRA